MVKLSIITLTYNKLEYTKKYVESLYKYTNDFELIIVDNGSTDGTVEFLKTLPDIKLILNDENKGFSKGNNQGLELAQGEYIGFLNNDILLYPNWFEECEKVFIAEDKAGFVSPRHLNVNYECTNDRNYIKYFQGFKFRKKYEKSFDECVFSCVLTKRTVLDSIGIFDENYTQAFFEDNDLKYRAILEGFGVLVCNTCCFFHYGSITSKHLNQNLEKNRAYYYAKYPFAEYLSASGHEKYELQQMNKSFREFPLNIIYSFHLFIQKVIRNLRRIIKL